MKTMVLPQINNTAGYHLSSYIDDIIQDEKTGKSYVTWLFPNGHKVELVFKTPENAELKYMSPEIILPEEGVDGQFYTSQEILLFLTRIKNLEA